MNRDLLIRADGDTSIGLGHAMRCLALAHAWLAAGGTATLATASLADGMRTRFAAAGIPIESITAPIGSDADADATARLAAAARTAWVVVDGYRFTACFRHRLRSAVPGLLAITDHGHPGAEHADLEVDQNPRPDQPTTPTPAVPAASPPAAPTGPAAPVSLRGPRYALLRPEFARWGRCQREIPARARRLLVSLGGADADGITGRILSQLTPLPTELAVDVLIGAANPRRDELRRDFGSQPGINLIVDCPDVAPVMAGADLALVAAGSVCWELAFMGLGILAVVQADNQMPVAGSLAGFGVGENLGWWRDLTADRLLDRVAEWVADADRRARAADRGRALVDGAGARRVVARMRGDPVLLRPATTADAGLLFRWANQARAQSFSSAPIPWEDHCRWFARKLQHPGTEILIAEDPQAPVGMVRFEPGDGGLVISVAVDEACRGRGLGPLIIAAGSRQVAGRLAGGVVHAFIKPDNHASIRAFTKAGYRPAEMTRIGGQPADHLVWSPSDPSTGEPAPVTAGRDRRT